MKKIKIKKREILRMRKTPPPPQREELWQSKKTDSPHTFTQVLVLREFFGNLLKDYFVEKSRKIVKQNFFIFIEKNIDLWYKI